MSILTALAVYTIGLVSGIFITWRVTAHVINKLCSDGNMELVAIYKCEEGHVHARVETAAGTPLIVVLEDGVPERAESEETTSDAA
jgi:hypothetical protein